MFKAAMGAVVLCSASICAAAAQPAICKKTVDETRLSATYTFKVAGKGRLHFHSAPHALCVSKTVFVVPGDSLDAYTTFGEQDQWVSVNYTKKDGEIVSGWVTSERLMFTGASGMNLTPEKHQYFTKAAAAAKAGQLGVP